MFTLLSLGNNLNLNAASATTCCPSAIQADENMGPMVGHVDDRSAVLLIRRGAKPQSLRLKLIDSQGNEVRSIETTTDPKSDFVAKFTLSKLQPDTTYRYQISRIEDNAEVMLANGEDLYFKTTSDLKAASSRADKTSTVCFVSCVDIEENPLWKGISNVSPDLICLMGDTPYIDSSDLSVVRKRHRDFLSVGGLSQLIKNTSTVGTWDDHDFGRNNGNGRNMVKGKRGTRQGFIEYRGHQRYGTGTEGVYHSVDLGMVEVFLLDPRYFSQTEPSPVDAKQTTCFGGEQWEWIQEKLKASKAPFKVLSFGQIWQDKKNGETDDMFTYWYERDALFDFVEREDISGVVLLGGDIHVSRHLVHPLRAGYDLHDFIISPGHKRTITELNVFHPSLRWSLVEGFQFLSLTADGSEEDPKLTVTFRQAEDVINREVVVRLSDLTAKPAIGIKRGLRGHWSFDHDFSNASQLGKWLDAKPANATTIEGGKGRFGGAVKFVRKQNQYLNVPRNPLDDNSDQHSVALWFEPTSLPTHGTNERQFLFESTAEGKPNDSRAWSLSLGIRPDTDPAKVCLQLYTHTLVPAAGPEQAPTAKSQGGFDFAIPRAALKSWTHAVVVYESTQLTLFVNGKKAKSFPLATPGPAAEFGGLIIGGHRAGVGRNFDGMIDDFAIWSRMLSDSEIKSLAKQSVAPIE